MQTSHVRIILSLLLLASTVACGADDANAKDGDNNEQAAVKRPKVGEPISLFNGKTLDGWQTESGKPVAGGWKVEDGAIYRESRGGNIFYEHEVGDFELTFEWKIVAGGNNGLKYRVRKYGGRMLGCEYQLLGETKPSLSKGSCGSLYELYEPNGKKQLMPIGEWNTARIVVADLASDEWRKRLAQSKFAPHKDFARNNVGRIMLTDHGSEVWYRNITLTPLADVAIPPLASESEKPASEKTEAPNKK